jgi:type II secretory pathway component GspD/PulD (secretin)
MMRKVLTLTLMFCLLATGLATLASADGAGGAAAAAAAASVAPGKIVAREAPKVVGLLRTTDKPQVQRYVPMAFELKNANPYEVAYFLRDAVSCESGLWGTFANSDKDGNVKGGVIIVCVPEYQLDKIRETIQMLDRPNFSSSSGTAWAYVQLHNRSCLDGDVPASLLQWVGNDVTIMPDVETNAVFLIGSPENVKGVIEAAKTYDVPTAMVTLAAKIYETDVTDDGALGLDFQSWKNGPGQKLFEAHYANYHVKPPNAESSHLTQRGGTFNGDYPSEFFDFLAVKGRAQVLVKSEVSVLSGISATFTSADDLLYYPVIANAAGQRVIGPAVNAAGNQVTSTIPRAGEVANAISAVAKVARTDERIAAGASNPAMTAQAGVAIAVTPVVAEDYINLDIQTTFNDLQGFDSNGTPMISARVLDNQTATANGQEVVLAKMTRSNTIQTSRKVPILGSIPVIGYLFGGEISGTRTTQVIESMTPTIVEKGGLGPQERVAIEQVKGNSRATVPGDEAFFLMYGIDY